VEFYNRFPLQRDFRVLLLETMDALEDWAGWTPDTVALVRVLMTSLITRISAQSKTLFSDVNGSAWRNFTDFTVRHPLPLFFVLVC
jgi:hypothetical protein